LLCVFVFFVLLGFVGKTAFSFATGRLIQIMKLFIGIALIYPGKAKQNLELLDGLSLSHKTWTGEGSTKVLCTLIRTLA
jgi:hypothetical protein